MIAGTDTRLPGFDGLRAIAALCIVVLHVTSVTMEPNRFTARLDIGVAVFFVISGFLLYRPFVAAHLGERPDVDLGRFWWRRFLRIYPAYWVALAAALLFFGRAQLDGGWAHVREFGLVQIYQPAYGLGGIPPAWTLAVEVSFYLTLPLYAFAVGLATKRVDVARRIHVELVAVALVYGGALLWRFVLVSERGADAVSARWLPAMADWFALGILLAVVRAGFDTAARADRFAWASVAGAVGAFVAVGNIGLPLTLAEGSGTVAEDLVRQVLYGAFGFFLVLPAALGRDSAYVRRVLDQPVAVALGTISYGIFLWHYDWLYQVVDWWPEIDVLPALVAVLAFTLVTATSSWFLVERPLLRGRRSRSEVTA